MADAKPPDEDLSEEERELRQYIRARLLTLRDRDGRRLSLPEARYLAEKRVDWHEVRELLERGATLDQARMIVL